MPRPTTYKLVTSIHVGAYRRHNRERKYAKLTIGEIILDACNYLSWSGKDDGRSK